MKSKRLLAAITASGALLCLNLTAKAHNPDSSRAIGETETLALRVEQLKAKLRSSAPAREQGATGMIENVVQFFNFLNSNRGKKRKI